SRNLFSIVSTKLQSTLRAIVGPGYLTAAAAELSRTSHPGLGVLSNSLFRGDVSASEILAPWLVDGTGRVYIPEHPDDLLPAEDEAPIEAYIPKVASAPTPLLPPSFISPCIQPSHTRAAMAQMRAAVPSTYHSLLPSGTLPLLPIPLPIPSTSRRAEIPEADTPPRKRLLLTAPRPGCKVGESSAAAAARQPGPTMARSVDCSFVDTIETRFRDTERRMMTALEMVNIRVSYQ
nr:hypothetical protein [Tanacetum cinerariifolium]